MPNRLARAPGWARSSGGRTASRLPARSDGEIGARRKPGRRRSGRPGPASLGTGWPAPVRGRRWCVAGAGSVSVSSVAPATQRREQARAEPAHPEEGHRDVEPVVLADAAGAESRGTVAADRAAVGVDHALRASPAARGEHDDQVVGRLDPLLHRLDEPRGCGLLGERVGREHALQRGQRRHGGRIDGPSGARPGRPAGRARRGSADRGSSGTAIRCATFAARSCGLELGRAQQRAERDEHAPIRTMALGGDGPVDAVRHQQADAVTACPPRHPRVDRPAPRLRRRGRR